MTDTQTNNVLIELDERGVATVTLNRPEKHNAFDDAIIAELTEAFNSVDRNPDARIMVLASNGKNFSAGGDLGWMKRMASYSYEENLADANALATMLHTLNFMRKPTIARVQGAAFGGAVGLVSCCDMAVATERASFSLSEVKIGLLPATISPYVVAAMGQRASRRYFLTAERFKSDKALALGLISEVVAEEQLDDCINGLIDNLLGNSPAAIEASKKLIFDVSGKDINGELMNQTSARIAAIRVSEEGQEGLTAFLEKRQPRWIKN
ncbi:MAG: enoyl-CoA hydratase-related protein [Candidatus Pelagadaptatus aseana]|uniref:enoyl-CoA hydratase/isomerase family protein n=1 Tax=Candidatus Pelagadaptatus aseana TaxID=3120508 RepID=UPI0039B1A311